MDRVCDGVAVAVNPLVTVCVGVELRVLCCDVVLDTLRVWD